MADTNLVKKGHNIVESLLRRRIQIWVDSTHAELAAAVLLAVLAKTESIMCTTPFFTNTSLLTILAVDDPDMTNVPVLFVIKVNDSPLAEVRFKDAEKAGL